jgi:hypothetical protein
MTTVEGFGTAEAAPLQEEVLAFKDRSAGRVEVK